MHNKNIERKQVGNVNTTEELVYYCNEAEPVGALLLSGEWGCGKTYLLEHEFKDALKDKAVVLRISLFGITSPEDIHAAVKSAWFEEFCILKGYNTVTEKIGEGKKFLTKLDFLPDWLKGIGSTDIASLFPISPQIEGKSVILIFDDLERCRMSSVDVLGIINDYCENQKFHTIIVANQEKMKAKHEPTQITGEIQHFPCNSRSSETPDHTSKISFNIPPIEKEGDLAFSEIKEKIIQRTVRYLPDYPKIVHAVICNLSYDDAAYKAFVTNCEDGLLNLFAPDRDDSIPFPEVGYPSSSPADNTPSVIPHNIRSLKCAIRDFYRVYCLLKENDIPDIEKWFYSFASYLIAFKADLLDSQCYGGLFSDDTVQAFYPVFNNKYMFAASKKWIQHGIWDSDHFKREIDWLKMQETAQSPVDILKSTRIIDVDEEIIETGLRELLSMAYRGELTLDEYVLLIQNCAWARESSYVFPIAIEWERVRAGVSIQIDKIKKDIPQGQILYSIIEESQKKYFSADEWNTYILISSFAFSSELIYLKNKIMYIDRMEKLGCSSFIHIQNKRFDCFDDEMATATAKAFEKENTSGKHEFVIYFSKVWTRNISSSEIRAEDCIVGFSTLLAELQALLSRINTGKRTFSVVHTESFIREVNILVKKLGSNLAKNTENNDSKSEEDNIENTVANNAGDTAEEAAENTAGDAEEDAAEDTAGDAEEEAAEDTAGDVAEDATEDTLEEAAKHSNELSQDNSQEELSQSTIENYPNAPAPIKDNPPTCNGPETGDNLSSMSPSENEDAL